MLGNMSGNVYNSDYLPSQIQCKMYIQIRNNENHAQGSIINHMIF